MDAYMKKWMKAAGIRAVKTVAQTAVATIGTAVAMGDVNWPLVVSASVLAGVLALVHQRGGAARGGVTWTTRKRSGTG